MRRGLNAHLAVLAVAVTLGTAAHAADLPSRRAPAPVVAAVPVFTWTGFYAGVNAGYGWNTNDDNQFVPGVGVVSNDSDGGFVGGGQVGYNYQIGSFVIGAEADIQYADVGGGNSYYTGPYGNDDEDHWFGTVRARAGVAFDRFLVYATGGLAYGDMPSQRTFFTTPTAAFYGNSDDVRVGWTIGAGVEYAFTNNLIARVEGLYVNLEKDDNDFGYTSKSKEAEFAVIRAGLNYKFSTY